MLRRANFGRAMVLPSMPTASGVECVRALIALGWVPAWWTQRECELVNGRCAVTVPLEAALSPARVTSIANLAGVPPFAFVEALERVLMDRGA